MRSIPEVPPELFCTLYLKAHNPAKTMICMYTLARPKTTYPSSVAPCAETSTSTPPTSTASTLAVSTSSRGIAAISLFVHACCAMRYAFLSRSTAARSI